VEQNHEESLRAYLENRIDLTFLPPMMIPNDLPKEQVDEGQGLRVTFLIFAPQTPPMDDLRVRKALGHAFDRQKYHQLFHAGIASGGLVPPGMPGHSPNIGLPYDVALGRKLLAETGYPGGKGFPVLTMLFPQSGLNYAEELRHQWRENLGVEVALVETNARGLDDWEKIQVTTPMMCNGWLADYPDPNNFLRQSDIITRLHYLGWRDVDYDRLVEEAARTSDRAKRMAMYRQADKRLVEEQALVLPISYGTGHGVRLVKPWMKNFKPNLLGHLMLQDVILEEH
jgi:oligopeptide transport system substrate-binding protein